MGALPNPVVTVRCNRRLRWGLSYLQLLYAAEIWVVRPGEDEVRSSCFPVPEGERGPRIGFSPTGYNWPEHAVESIGGDRCRLHKLMESDGGNIFWRSSR